MNELKAMLFSIQRFQILALFTNPNATRNVTPSYAFAWAESIYTFLNHVHRDSKPMKNAFPSEKNSSKNCTPCWLIAGIRKT